MTGRLCQLAMAAMLASCLCTPDTLMAASVSSSPKPPQTGLEMPGDPMKGRPQKPIGGFVDAYGNPITGEVEEKAPKKRLPAGAYGGYKKPERPLPDVKDDTPLW